MMGVLTWWELAALTTANNEGINSILVENEKLLMLFIYVYAYFIYIKLMWARY